MKSEIVRIGICFCFVIAGCSKQESAVRITAEQPPKAAKETPKTRVEPVFYNGKTYQVTLAPNKQGYDMRVAGMGAAQQKDAEAVSKSSLGYFACKDSQQVKVTAKAVFDSGLWRMSAQCV
jgi:hypothetical protein